MRELYLTDHKIGLGWRKIGKQEISGGAHVHWHSGVTPEKVGGLFKQFFLPDYDMTMAEADGMEMTFKIGIEDNGWYDQEVEESWEEDILRNGRI